MFKDEKGILHKNFCDRCNKFTWHQYITHKIDSINNKRKKIESYYKCNICERTRQLKDWKGK